jgi:hypothetical protein
LRNRDIVRRIECYTLHTALYRWEDAIAVTLEGIYRYESGGYEQFLDQ